MRAYERFLQQPMAFWANIRAISQEVGYSVRGEDSVKVPTWSEIRAAMRSTGLGVSHLEEPEGSPTPLGLEVMSYFEYRAAVLNEVVQHNLMMADEAGPIFEKLRDELNPTCPLPGNKQKGDKAGPALFTGIINMIIEANAEGVPVDYDPRKLTTVTRDGAPLRTLSRRVDGAIPGHVNPIAVWEIKEYYYTTTFGSRVADGVYESLLDGMELEELQEHEGVEVQHILMVDAHYTWWTCGKSYLCRIIDMLHMGYIDEVLFGREVVERLPEVVKVWVAEYRVRTEGR